MSEFIVGTDDHEGHWLTGEKIVRCRDCKYYQEEWIRKLCHDTIYCDWFDGAHVEPDGFCAWGERK